MNAGLGKSGWDRKLDQRACPSLWGTGPLGPRRTRCKARFAVQTGFCCAPAAVQSKRCGVNKPLLCAGCGAKQAFTRGGRKASRRSRPYHPLPSGPPYPSRPPRAPEPDSSWKRPRRYPSHVRVVRRIRVIRCIRAVCCIRVVRRIRVTALLKADKASASLEPLRFDDEET